MDDIKVSGIEKECIELISRMKEKFEQAEFDEDLHEIDEMKTAIKYMNEMHDIIKKYR